MAFDREFVGGFVEAFSEGLGGGFGSTNSFPGLGVVGDHFEEAFEGCRCHQFVALLQDRIGRLGFGRRGDRNLVRGVGEEAF